MNDKRIVSIFFISYLNSMRRKFQFQMLSITASLASSKSNTGNVKPKRSSMWTSALSVINRADLQQLQKDWSLVFFFFKKDDSGFQRKVLEDISSIIYLHRRYFLHFFSVQYKSSWYSIFLKKSNRYY